MYILEHRLIMSMKSSVESLLYFRDSDIVIFEVQHSISKVIQRLTFYEKFHRHISQTVGTVAHIYCILSIRRIVSFDDSTR